MTDDVLARAEAARHAGRYAEALQLLTTALGAGPDAALWTERGRVYGELNNVRQARADFTAASEADPAGELGDRARAELLRLLTPKSVSNATPRPQPAPRPLPHAWVRTLVVLLLLASIGCAVISIVGYGRYPLRPAIPTAAPARTLK